MQWALSLELQRLRDELKKERYLKTYRELRMNYHILTPFPTPISLVDFFHRQSSSFKLKDYILKILIQEYQRGRYWLSTLFLVLFTPAIIRVYAIAKKKALELDPAEILNEICICTLEELKSIDPHSLDQKVSSKVIGRVKNRIRAWVNKRLKDEKLKEPFLDNCIYPKYLPIKEEKSLPDIEHIERFLNHFVKEGIITQADKFIILGSKLLGKSLKEMAKDGRDYQRIKKRRQRAIKAIKRHLKEQKEQYQKEQGLREGDVTLLDIIREILK